MPTYSPLAAHRLVWRHRVTLLGRFGSGKRYFGSIDGHHRLEDPHVVIQGDRVLHLRFRVRR